MMKQEFISLTGIVPTDALYEQIEKEYMSSKNDKQTFCKRYAEDTVFQSRIVEAANKEHLKEIEGAVLANDTALKKIEALRAEINSLERDLEKEQEWLVVDDDGSVSDDLYDSLYADCQLVTESDDAAKETLHSYFGFDREMIRILHKAWKYERNRHGVLRRTELVDRSPLHFASDMNYYLFDCGAYTYEVWNGELHKYNGYGGEV